MNNNTIIEIIGRPSRVDTTNATVVGVKTTNGVYTFVFVDGADFVTLPTGQVVDLLARYGDGFVDEPLAMLYRTVADQLVND
jgi:hypothetical protein